MWSRLFIALALSALMGCGTAGPRSVDTAAVKNKLAVVLSSQRANAEWMRAEGCPFESAPEISTRPILTAKDCADSPADCVQRCDSGDGSACHATANLIQEHYEIENDVAQALFRKACRLGIAAGCTNAAAHLLEVNEKANGSCALRTFDYSCRNADPWGCSMYGMMLSQGVAGPSDKGAAVVAFDRACEVSADKSSPACVNAREMKARVQGN